MRHVLQVLTQFVLLIWLAGCGPAAEAPVIFHDDFGQGVLDSSRWQATRDGDFAESTVDVYDVDPGQASDYRLRLRGSTIGTSDPLKFLGVRSKRDVDFSGPRTVSFDLDWNNQPNGCYLTAALFLCPTVSSNPVNEDNWLKFEYTGVPPGRNVRVNVWEKVNGLVKELRTDWGPSDADGRPVGRPLAPGNHRIELLLDPNGLRVREDGTETYGSTSGRVTFSTAYIYLQMSSGTNYSAREVYFDNIAVVNRSAG